MNILVTGGGGLVGSEMPNQALKPSRAELDLMDYRQLRQYVGDNDISEIIHLAAKVGGVRANDDQMLSFFSDNLTINANIIRVCAEMSIHAATFVLSTCVFPANARYPVNEDNLHEGEPHPTNYGYAYAKRMLEVGARALRRKRVWAKCVIPCNIFGKHDNYDMVNGHVIPSLIHKCYLAKRDRTPLQVWGTGSCEREFVYAPDIARAIWAIHMDERPQMPVSMIVSPAHAHTIRYAVERIVQAMDFDGSVVWETDKPEGIHRKPTINHLFRKYYPHFEFTPFERGITETCKFVQQNYDSIRK